ncbi:MAG: glycine/sarcosine/betaine reductase selenoprotein B family protein [Desulfobacterales bacterium]
MMDSFKFFTDEYTEKIKKYPFIENHSFPWTPLEKSLNDSKVAIVSTAGVHPKSQKSFDVESKKGDWSYREILKDLPTSELMITHTHYDHSDADADINCVFPIDRLRELENEKVIGRLAKINYGFMGFIPNPTPLREKTAKEMAQKLKDADIDIAFLTPG